MKIIFVTSLQLEIVPIWIFYIFVLPTPQQVLTATVDDQYVALYGSKLHISRNEVSTNCFRITGSVADCSDSH